MTIVEYIGEDRAIDVYDTWDEAATALAEKHYHVDYFTRYFQVWQLNDDDYAIMRRSH